MPLCLDIPVSQLVRAAEQSRARAPAARPALQSRCDAATELADGRHFYGAATRHFRDPRRESSGWCPPWASPIIPRDEPKKPKTVVLGPRGRRA